MQHALTAEAGIPIDNFEAACSVIEMEGGKTLELKKSKLTFTISMAGAHTILTLLRGAPHKPCFNNNGNMEVRASLSPGMYFDCMEMREEFERLVAV